MERLLELLGRENDVDHVARTLYAVASSINAPVVGAMLVTCSDESEKECVDAFQHGFARNLLPDLKFGERSVFRGANLGGRYEWGAAQIAEEHFSTDEARRGFKLMVIKINAHVAFDASPADPHFGTMQRYDTEESFYCGALHAVLAGDGRPFAADLVEALQSEHVDRVGALLDEQRVPPQHRSLCAALASARLQARRALVDIQDRRPASPTLFLVLPCVTLNRRLKDTEIVCGFYRADWRGDEPIIDYQGMGDAPEAYRVGAELGRLVVSDDHIETRRSARDHRQLVLEQWQVHRQSTPAPPHPPSEGMHDEARQTLDALLEDVQQKKHYTPDYAKQMLLTLVKTLALFDPITATIVLFSESVLGIQYLHNVHRIARNVDTHTEARSILHRIGSELDRLPAERARAVLELLVAHHRR